VGVKQWVALAEVLLGNLAWIDALDLEGFLVATALAIGAAAAIWIFAGPVWLLVAGSLYIGLLVGVRFVANRGRDDGEPPEPVRRPGTP
jgi:hypothetical protein